MEPVSILDLGGDQYIIAISHTASYFTNEKRDRFVESLAGLGKVEMREEADQTSMILFDNSAAHISQNDLKSMIVERFKAKWEEIQVNQPEDISMAVPLDGKPVDPFLIIYAGPDKSMSRNEQQDMLADPGFIEAVEKMGASNISFKRNGSKELDSIVFQGNNTVESIMPALLGIELAGESVNRSYVLQTIGGKKEFVRE